MYDIAVAFGSAVANWPTARNQDSTKSIVNGSSPCQLRGRSLLSKNEDTDGTLRAMVGVRCDATSLAKRVIQVLYNLEGSSSLYHSLRPAKAA